MTSCSRIKCTMKNMNLKLDIWQFTSSRNRNFFFFFLGGWVGGGEGGGGRGNMKEVPIVDICNNDKQGQDGPVSLTWLPDKFWVNWHFGSREEVQYRFSRWWPSWICDRNDFNYLWQTLTDHNSSPWALANIHCVFHYHKYRKYSDTLFLSIKLQVRHIFFQPK